MAVVIFILLLSSYSFFTVLIWALSFQMGILLGSREETVPSDIGKDNQVGSYALILIVCHVMCGLCIYFMIKQIGG